MLTLDLLEVQVVEVERKMEVVLAALHLQPVKEITEALEATPMLAVEVEQVRLATQTVKDMAVMVLPHL